MFGTEERERLTLFAELSGENDEKHSLFGLFEMADQVK